MRAVLRQYFVNDTVSIVQEYNLPPLFGVISHSIVGLSAVAVEGNVIAHGYSDGSVAIGSTKRQCIQSKQFCFTLLLICAVF